MLMVLLEQLFYVPVYQVVFYLVLALAEGQPPHEGVRRALKSLPRSLPASWLFWVPTQLINYGLVPPHARVIFVNVFNLFWNVFLSHFNASSSRPDLPTGAVTTSWRTG